MKNTTNTPLTSKTLRGINMKKLLFLFATILLLSFTGDSGRAVYEVPRFIGSITCTDKDFDGDIDLITGHNIAWGEENPSVTILQNQGIANFVLTDSSKIFSGYQVNIFAMQFDSDGLPDLVTFYSDFSSGEAERYIRIFYNNQGNYSNFQDFTLNSSSRFDYINYGDFNGDGNNDIVVTSGQDQFFKVLYNDGAGGLSVPEEYSVENPYRNNIACGDLDENGMDDIVITGVNTEVYFSYPSQFELLELAVNTGLGSPFVIDFDLDGDKDIIGYNIFFGYTYLIKFNNLNGTSFEQINDFSFEGNADAFYLSDMDNDSLPDAVFHLMDNTGLVIYYNQGDFVLDKPVFIDYATGFGAGCDMVCADFDNNGYNDIAFTQNLITKNLSTVNILFNDGQGGFSEDPITTIPETNSSKSSPYQLTCFPNPVKTHSIFSFKQPGYSKSSIHLTDLRGNLVVALEPIQDRDGNVVLDISQHRLKHGLYIASLFVDNQMVESIKIVVE